MEIIIIFALASQAFCFEANAVIELIAVDKGSTTVRATYIIRQLNNVPFNILRYITLKETVTIDRKIQSKKQYNLFINYYEQDMNFNKKTDDFLFESDPATGKYYTIIEFDFGDVLNTIFKCKNYSRTYVSRFLYLDYESDNNSDILNA